MTKNDYRKFFASVKPFIKFKYFLNLCGVNPVSFSRFMKNENWNYALSIQKLDSLYKAIIDEYEKIA